MVAPCPPRTPRCCPTCHGSLPQLSELFGSKLRLFLLREDTQSSSVVRLAPRGVSSKHRSTMGRLTFLSLGFVAAALALAARAELPDGVNLRSQGPNSSSCRGTQTNEAISVVVDEYTLTTTFSCSAELAALVPSYTPSTPLETCHVQQDWSGQPTQISQAFGIKEGTLTKGEKPQNDYTLSLSSMPSDRAKKIYYKCKPTADDSKNCIVTVSLPAAPKSSKLER